MFFDLGFATVFLLQKIYAKYRLLCLFKISLGGGQGRAQKKSSIL
jgi:hypothetical protein